ncbi:glycosyltransferase [Arthrobacter sp. B1I2]|uniref:glycosyltransferase n=1 Tax=Arthrobacter sp. B1I2 TaxID=3042263 RepID=UPI0027875300|nr:glycosyltransferase involved in cell wall biosynthesis [Arthrobacter sp. B1I2]
MRLLFASHSAELAGAELCLVTLVQTATARGHTGVVSVPRNGPLVGLLGQYKSSFRVVITPVRPWMGRRFLGPVAFIRLVQALAGLFTFRRLLKNEHFDLVVVNTAVIPAPLLAAKAAGIRSLLIVRESLMTNPTLRCALPRRLVRWLLFRWATKVITNSDYISRQFSHLSRMIYPELSNEHFVRSPCRPHPLVASPLRAVMLGTLSFEKGQTDAVRALAKVRDMGVTIHLDIYGHGSKREVERLHRAILRLGLHELVTIHPPTSNPKRAFERADVSIVCSRNEAFGMVTAESVLSGTPVVGYDRGGTSEILGYGGGVLVAPEPASLAKALVDLDKDRNSLARLAADCEGSAIRRLLVGSPDRVLDFVESVPGIRSS